MRFIYDLETYPNCFLFGAQCENGIITVQYEITAQVDQSRQIIEFTQWLANGGHDLVGFKNIDFDYPILHLLLK